MLGFVDFRIRGLDYEQGVMKPCGPTVRHRTEQGGAAFLSDPVALYQFHELQALCGYEGHRAFIKCGVWQIDI